MCAVFFFYQINPALVSVRDLKKVLLDPYFQVVHMTEHVKML